MVAQTRGYFDTTKKLNQDSMAYYLFNRTSNSVLESIRLIITFCSFCSCKKAPSKPDLIPLLYQITAGPPFGTHQAGIQLTQLRACMAHSLTQYMGLSLFATYVRS
jgi:hypothetical protein